jgi:hypothetical protein
MRVKFELERGLNSGAQKHDPEAPATGIFLTCCSHSIKQGYADKLLELVGDKTG